MVKTILYGLLDDEGNVIRWSDVKPSHDGYVEKIVKQERKKHVDKYALAVKLVGYSGF